MATLTLLLPELRRVRMSGVLARWLARADRLTCAAPGNGVALRECFEFTGTSLPVAALTRAADAGDAGDATWLRADLCNVAVDAVAVRMLAWGNLGLDRAESDELARALRPLFGDAGFPLEATTPERWYLRCPAAVPLPRFVSPGLVLGDSLLRHLPTGENERQWRHLLNEAQVILHNHRVNMRRVERGQVPANSLWFWGAGKLPEWVRTRFTRAISQDAVVIGLARLAKIAIESSLGHATANDAQLLDLREYREGDSLELAWLAHVAEIYERTSELDLRFVSGERFLLKPRHRWRLWRRVPAFVSA
jgi:hypothetical protein